VVDLECATDAKIRGVVLSGGQNLLVTAAATGGEGEIQHIERGWRFNETGLRALGAYLTSGSVGVPSAA
jgi:hypothetical protein